MSADWSQVSLWRSAALDEDASSLRATEDALVELGYDTFGSQWGPWTGAAALFAGIRRNLLKESLEDRITEVSAVRRALQDASDSVIGVETAVRAATSFAAEKGLWIAGDGTVNDERPVTLQGNSLAPDISALLDDRRRTMNECLALVEEAVRRAYDVDTDLFALLNGQVLSGNLARRDAAGPRQAQGDGATTGTLGPYMPPRDSATPEQNAAWWAGLPAAEQDRIRQGHPAWIANRDGLSAGLRDEANRRLLAQYTQGYTDEYTAIGAYLDAEKSAHPDYARVVGETDDESERYRWLRDEVMPALATLNTISSYDDRQIIGLKIIPGQRVQAILAVGDVDAADDISVFTPGFTTTAAKLLGYDQKMQHLKNRADAMAQSEADRAGPPLIAPTVATVTWLDYQAPQVSTLASSNSVLSTHTAHSAGGYLGDFYEGINISRAADPHLVALGHSYGSAVTGMALTKDTGIDDAVVFGSPGLPIKNVGELKIHGSLYNEQADGDWLVGDSWATGFDPDHMLGTVQLGTGASIDANGGHLLASHGHSEYLTAGTTSENNLAAVIINQTGMVVGKK